MQPYFLQNLDPFYNLAVEEHLLTNSATDIFMLWRNENTIVAGRNQNITQEINPEFVKTHKINVARRITGGGTVYHDLNNINFSFIFNIDAPIKNCINQRMRQIASALRAMDVPASIDGRNDICVSGKKISGSAQYIYKKRLLHHGTLLFDSDLDILNNALNVSPEKIQSKAVQSIRSRVTNIKNWLPNMHTETFMQNLLRHLFPVTPAEVLKLAPQDEADVHKLRAKYLSWEWTYGKTPAFTFRNKRKFPGGIVEVFLDIKNGIISDCAFFGDFLSLSGISPLCSALRGLRYEPTTIKDALQTMPLELYFGSISADELLQCIFADI